MEPSISSNSSHLHQAQTGWTVASQHLSLCPWEQVKAHLTTSCPPEEFLKWIAPLKATHRSDRQVTIFVPNMLFYQVIIDRFLALIERAKSEMGIEGVLFNFECDAADPIGSTLESSELPPPNPMPPSELRQPSLFTQNTPSLSGTTPQDSPRPAATAIPTLSALNANYTFSTFVSGPSNQFAYSNCERVADNPGRAYNPLFIYGSTGLGKTHLLHAVANKVRQSNPNAVLTYITSEHFMNEMIYCMRFQKMWEFRQKYRQCDVFLVDDIQFISGNKEKTQEEFFHTFNALYEAKKQIVITSDMFPQDIPDIEDRLRNRFQWGLIADIQPPDTEHRVAILLKKAEKMRIKLSEDVALYIANHAKKNVRELEGALHRINAFANIEGRPINLELAMQTFHNILSEAPKLLTIETIQKIVADHYKIKVSDLKSHKRQRNLTMPRQIAMYLSRELTKASFPELGERFGGKDHTTVMHAVKKIDKDRTKDLDLKAHIDSLRRQLEQLH